jgi:hypothetical protein
MKNRVMYIYLLVVIFLFVAFSFSFYIQLHQENNLQAKQTQRVQETLDEGLREFHIQLTAIAERTPTP